MKRKCIFFLAVIFWLMPFSRAVSQSVIIDGQLVFSGSGPFSYKDYWAELRSDDSVLIEKQRINMAGNFTFQLLFAHDYYLAVRDKEEVIWRLLVHNKLEAEKVHYPVVVELKPKERERDVYEVTFDKEGNKQYLKNGMPITEITYRFETGRRDSSEIIIK